MKITLLLNQTYPYGYALTKRFHLYAKGFIRNGHSANILIPLPTEKSEKTKNTKTSGVYDEVPYNYTTPSTIRSKNFLLRRMYDFTGAINAGKFILREKPDIIITSTFSVVFFIFLRIISLSIPIKIFRERNEVDNLKKDKVPSHMQLKSKYESKLFHGSVIINKQLKHHIENNLKNKSPNIIVPILIEDFKSSKKLPVKNTIVYTGTYRERKDGILTILQAFSILRKAHPEYKMILTGSPKGSKDYKKIMDLIASQNLEAHVNFTGYLSEEELRNELIAARMLIITKPDNRQNHYNFPTKIGEYLISGRPVISTRVGIVGELLEDHKNVVFSGYDATEISKKMAFIINNPDAADVIGENGRQYALTNFNYKNHTKRMIDFFNQLITQNNNHQEWKDNMKNPLDNDKNSYSPKKRKLQ
ncbi:MAG: glycosyltransferase family 4 protein [bacterium]